MSYFKKISCLLLSASLLTILPSDGEDFKPTPYSTTIALGATGCFIAIAYGIHYYHNYYKVDHFSAEYFLEKLAAEAIKAHNFLILLSTNDLNSTITNAYPHFPYPYLTCHSQIESTISELIYCTNALNRKFSQNKFSDKAVIAKYSQLIEQLRIIQSSIENTCRYISERKERE